MMRNRACLSPGLKPLRATPKGPGPSCMQPRSFRPWVCLLLVVLGTVALAQHSRPAPERSTVVAAGHPLAVWVRRPATAEASVVLVHGRTWSSRPDWDLQVPGLDRSVMESLAARGTAAYAVDLRGYGETPRDTSGWNTPGRSAADVLEVVTWVRRQHPTLPPPVLVGWSRGGAIAMLAAQQSPASLSGVVLFGFAFDPSLQFGVVDEPADLPARLANSAESAASDFISPRVTPPSVIRAFVEQALGADPTLVDVKGDRDYQVLRPSQVTIPTLVIFGERDPAYDVRDTRRFVNALATPTKRLIVLEGADHAAQLEDTHAQWVDAVAAFAKRAR